MVKNYILQICFNERGLHLILYYKMIFSRHYGDIKIVFQNILLRFCFNVIEY